MGTEALEKKRQWETVTCEKVGEDVKILSGFLGQKTKIRM